MTRLMMLLAVLPFAATASAHEVRPAYLQIRQDAPDHFVISWKQPAMGRTAIRLIPHLSLGWLETAPAGELITPGFLLRTWQVRAPASNVLSGCTVRIEGLERTITDALVSVRLADGRSFDTILKPDRTSVQLTFQHTRSLAARAYFQLGVEHILTGIDHLMFVLGLLLLVGFHWRLVKAITAFTVAHSITLAVSAVGIVHVPSTAIEALVALSIVFVASELINQKQGRNSLAARHPWLIAFIFGLLHGFAFAGALAEVGLPQGAIALSLLLFNLGVEVGQLLFVGAALVVILALRRMWSRLPVHWYGPIERIPPYAIGSFAAFWFLERIAAVFV
jgi:hydrogenase/urease accessory protein HupE